MGRVALDEIRIAFETLIIPIVGKRGEIVPANQSFDEAKSKLFYRVWAGFGPTRGIELGGQDSLSSRVGLCKIPMSLLAGKPLNDLFAIAEDIEKASRRILLPAGECQILCLEPYFQQIGTAPDNRFTAEVNIPWEILFNH